MKKLLLPLLAFAFHVSSAQNVSRPHPKFTVIDTHNDVISNQLITKVDLGKEQTQGNFDLIRAKKASLGGQVFSIWCGDQYGYGTAYAYANREIDSLMSLINRNPGKTALVRTAKDLRRMIKQKKLAAMIGVEGGHMIEDRLDYIDSLHNRGMVYLTLTWNNSTGWASSARDEVKHADTLKHKGLNEFGRQVVRKLNKLGIMIDLSHPGEQTFNDVMALTTKPVIASHSCAYALAPHRRNLKDYQLKAIAKNGGVVFVNFYSGFIDTAYEAQHEAYLVKHKVEMDSLNKVYNDYDLASIRLNVIHKEEAEAFRPPLAMLIKHIDYMVRLMGVDHVGIGSDFDGAESYPKGIDSVLDYEKIATELMKLKYTEKEIGKIMSGNFIRVLKANAGK
ncbi:membrane dipeptidase [Mucilaginibacter pallidiroseus]|uniref:Membrane dipeptidase n=1 Tax=Mucilaginibacter pallidiroseus TaxID=2599295 RepID=A0A563UJ06_9SPHI|nr:dipeptidase [Mucilaginibacter pallidiroseus]TWR31258.1 membrane dipeptidase [Mucilaginibacter pallidiroseus]